MIITTIRKAVYHYSMNRDLFKAHILCQIFPSINGIYFGAVFTPTESLVSYGTNITGLKKSLSIAVQEICDYVDGDMNESDFVNCLQEREKIMRGIIQEHGIPLHQDLYYCLTEYFHNIQESYRPFESLLPKENLRGESDIFSPDDDFTPIWDGRERKFIPLEKSLSSILLCERLTLTVVKAARWEPVSGDIYYHPTCWNPKDKKFIPMSDQAAFAQCRYPAFQTEEECQSVCNTLTAIMRRDTMTS